MKIIHNNNALQQFRNHVGVRFQLYNSLFTALPFHKIESTGVMLALFLLHCEEGYKKHKSPREIVDTFFEHYTSLKGEKEKNDLLFRFIQYAERQVVLFDALEDGAFAELHDMVGTGSVINFQSQIEQSSKEAELKEKLKDYCVRLTLTAHPTQFYPGEVLGIIHDLATALKSADAAKVNMYLQQLAKTPFFRQQKPTPFDEAKSLIWYLEHVFYPACGNILDSMKEQFGDTTVSNDNPIMRMGFWPGGDRDGNPFVKTETTIRVAKELRNGIIRAYYKDIRAVRRRLTFKGVEDILWKLENVLYTYLFTNGSEGTITKEFMLSTLNEARTKLIELHNGLFIFLLDNLICKVQIFGVFFATLDIRQDSGLHKKLLDTVAAKTDLLPSDYASLDDKEKIKALLAIPGPIKDLSIFDDEIQKDTIEVISGIEKIQALSGEEGCNRYIISHSTSALNVIEVMAIFKLGGWKGQDIPIDIMPLFESIEDLNNAGNVMAELYAIPEYHAHLQNRKKMQSIMMGFSDGTKDGGYLMANWCIYKAKEDLTRASRNYDIDVVFFDGRGGPPSRGGGKSQKFYASLGNNIENKEIQLTIQGQTVSSNFGTVEAAQYNIEQLVTAGLANSVLKAQKETLTKEEENILSELSQSSFEAYCELKEHPDFFDYLENITPLRYFGKANIGSRPSKRNADAKLDLDVLRAIPYVGSWSQVMQNITGYFGVGTALKKIDEAGKLETVKHLYRNSLFFRTLLENSEMSMNKCFFPLTAYLAKDEKYGEIWRKIFDEFELTQNMLLRISGHSTLMENYPVEALSIQMRERIILPLVTVQQYGMSKVRESNPDESFEKMIMRCSFGIINAGRNSA